MGVTDYFPFLCEGGSIFPCGKGEIERRRRTDPVSGLRDIVFHGVFSLPLLGGLSYNAIYDKNYAK